METDNKTFADILKRVNLRNVYILNNNIRIFSEYILTPNKFDPTQLFNNDIHGNTFLLFNDLIGNKDTSIFGLFNYSLDVGYMGVIYTKLTNDIYSYNDKRPHNINERLKIQDSVAGKKYIKDSNDILNKYYDQDDKKLFTCNYDCSHMY